MVATLGVDIRSLFTVIFGLGAALAGLAGLMAGPIQSVQMGMGESIMITSLVVIVIGGIGSIHGAFIAWIIVGLTSTFGRILLSPALSDIGIYVVMVAIIFWRPADCSQPMADLGTHRRFFSLVRLGSDPGRAQLRRTVVLAVCIALLALVPALAQALDEPFLVSFFTRVLIFGAAAVSLDLILGYGGMVSFGHAAFLGIGAYTVGILAWHEANAEPLLTWPLAVNGTSDVALTWPAAMLVAAVAALLIGFVALRTGGLFFIMITLAFAQMMYYTAIALQKYGGDDGFQIRGHPHLGTFYIGGHTTFYYITLALLVVILAICYPIVNSRFGMIIRGAAQNHRRMLAIGFPTFRYQLTCFVISGALAGLVGALFASAAQFVSPADLSWNRSADILIMIIIGGTGTVFGPVLGAAAYLVLELVLSSITIHWQALLGPLLIILVLFAKRGILGLFGPPVPSDAQHD